MARTDPRTAQAEAAEALVMRATLRSVIAAVRHYLADRSALRAERKRRARLGLSG